LDFTDTSMRSFDKSYPDLDQYDDVYRRFFFFGNDLLIKPINKSMNKINK